MDIQKNVTVSLVWPVTVEGTTYESLTFRRMKAKDALVAEGEENKVRAGYRLFAVLAGVDVSVIEELDIEDFSTISDKVAPFMGKSLMDEAMAGSPASGAT